MSADASASGPARKIVFIHGLPLRTSSIALLCALVAGVAPRIPASAEIYATSEALCDQMATTAKKRSVQDFRNMTMACATAVAWHRQRAQTATGAAQQQELLLEATYLYFAAEGETGAHHTSRAIAILKRSRQLYEDVFNNGLTPDVRRKAQFGLGIVDAAMSPASPAPR